MQSGLSKIDDFFESSLSVKLQKLRDAKAIIKKDPNLPEPVQSLTLYDNTIWKKKVPLLKNDLFKQAIPTAIGVFMMNINLDFFMALSGYLEIIDYRNLKASMKLEAFLDVRFEFSYGLSFILEFGLQVKGKLVKA